ncbi:uncharacterized protein [Macrobrachium rosenbergii]|uniref:uncharacterized protein isoform X2 n=1 Tax=Macrobrachium rosenbergii TaxID=79674 RepID=UPI0034D5B195
MNPHHTSTPEPIRGEENDDNIYDESTSRIMSIIQPPHYQYVPVPEPQDGEHNNGDEYKDKFNKSFDVIVAAVQPPHYLLPEPPSEHFNACPKTDTASSPAPRDDGNPYEEFFHALENLDLPDEGALNSDVREEGDPFEEIFNDVSTPHNASNQAPAGEPSHQECTGNQEAARNSPGGLETGRRQGGGGTGPTLSLQRRRGNRTVHILDYSILVGSHVDVMTVLQQSENRITRDVYTTLCDLGAYSGNIYLSLTITLEKLTANSSETNRFYINTPVVLTKRDKIHELFDTALNYLPSVLEERLGACEGSGWRIHALEKLAVIYARRRLSNIQNYVEYPKGLRGSHQIVNIRSGYNCLITCLLAYKSLTKKQQHL